MQLFRQKIQLPSCISSYFLIPSMAAHYLVVVLAMRTFRTTPVPSYSFSALQIKELFLNLGVTPLCIHFSVLLDFGICRILNSAPAVPPVTNLGFFIVLKSYITFYQCSTNKICFFLQGMENCSPGCQNKHSKCTTYTDRESTHHCYV